MDTSHAAFCDIEVGESEHHAVGLDRQATRLYDIASPNDEARCGAVFDQLGVHGPVLIVVDQPNTIGALPVTVGRACGHRVAYLPGLSMRGLLICILGTRKPKLADSLKEILQQRKSIGDHVERMLDTHPLSASPNLHAGVGVRPGARILLEVGDGSAFASAGHLAAYAGIAPVTHRSGPRSAENTPPDPQPQT